MGAFGINLFLKACDQSSQRNVIDHSDAPKTTATNHYHLFKSLNNYQQVNCGIGRDSVEAWGRKKRSVGGKEETSQTGAINSDFSWRPKIDDQLSGLARLPVDAR